MPKDRHQTAELGKCGDIPLHEIDGPGQVYVCSSEFDGLTTQIAVILKQEKRDCSCRAQYREHLLGTSLVPGKSFGCVPDQILRITRIFVRNDTPKA